MANMVDTITTVMPRKNNTKGEKERKVTRMFYLISNNREKICVYNKMFLVTLRLKKDEVVSTILGKMSGGQLQPSTDSCGCNEPTNKLPESVTQIVKEHIMSYNPCISHYRREHVPFRLYIRQKFTIRSMYQDFCESHQIKIYYSFYRS